MIDSGTSTNLITRIPQLLQFIIIFYDKMSVSVVSFIKFIYRLPFDLVCQVVILANIYFRHLEESGFICCSESSWGTSVNIGFPSLRYPLSYPLSYYFSSTFVNFLPKFSTFGRDIKFGPSADPAWLIFCCTAQYYAFKICTCCWIYI